MSYLKKHIRVIAVGVCCAAIGAGASVIATAGAASGTSNGGASSAVRTTGKHSGRRGNLFAAAARRSVQGSVVVYTRNGFVTVTFERGFVQSVSGQQLTMTEATRKATYKTVTLIIPANAVVRLDGKKSSLANLKQGQHVLVVQSPSRTLVSARDVRST